MVQTVQSGSAAGAVPAVMDVPVIMQATMGLAIVKVPKNSSSHRDGYASSVGMAAMKCFLVFCPLFAHLQVVWS